MASSSWRGTRPCSLVGSPLLQMEGIVLSTCSWTLTVLWIFSIMHYALFANSSSCASHYLSITVLPCFVALSGILFRCLDMCWHTNMTNVRYGRGRGLWETLGKVESLTFVTQTNYILPGWNLTSDKGLGLVWLNLLPKDHLAQWEDYQTCKL